MSESPHTGVQPQCTLHRSVVFLELSVGLRGNKTQGHRTHYYRLTTLDQSQPLL